MYIVDLFSDTVSLLFASNTIAEQIEIVNWNNTKPTQASAEIDRSLFLQCLSDIGIWELSQSMRHKNKHNF